MQDVVGLSPLHYLGEEAAVFALGPVGYAVGDVGEVGRKGDEGFAC